MAKHTMFERKKRQGKILTGGFVRTPDHHTDFSNDLPEVVQEVIGSKGQPLDVGARASIEPVFRQDFSQVKVHTGIKASESARYLGARAFAAGNNIVFNEGEYNPGTIVGNALIAHELAHVSQQGSRDSEVGLEESSLEDAANAMVVNVVARKLSGARSAFSQTKRTDRSQHRSALRLQRCTRAERLQPPAFFGRYSQETLETINRRMEAGAALANWVAFGQTVVSFENPISAMDTPHAAEALAAIPTIVKSRVRDDIDFLRLEHGNELNAEEKAFWDRLYDKLLE